MRLSFCVMLIAMVSTAAMARDQLRIVGSSTVRPFATEVAINFGKATGLRTPVIESTGSGGGLMLFCQGVGIVHPDIANASRLIKPSELDLCAENGVTDITEVKIGFDAVVLVSANSVAAYALTSQQIFMALAKRVPVDGRLVDNPYNRWSDINPSLPAAAIEVIGPPPFTGTRDTFVERVMRKGALAFPTLAKMRKRSESRFRGVADAIREDGRFVVTNQSDKLVVQRLEKNPTALGIFDISFLVENGDRILGASIDGQEPTPEAIADGSYQVRRSLYFYVKEAHVGLIPGITDYVDEFVSDRALGEAGYLRQMGLVPLKTSGGSSIRKITR